MTSKPVEEGEKRALTSTGFDDWAAHVGWAKIKTNTFYSIFEWFNMQVFIYIKNSKKILCVNLVHTMVTYIYMANIV